MKVVVKVQDEAEAEAEKHKVEMQKLHMSEENQELIKAALIEVRGDLKLREQRSYRDQRRRLENGYWLKDNQLLVRGVKDFSRPQEDGLEDEDEGSGFRLQRLMSVGFHKSRCCDVLDRTNGDVGAALELLLSESFDLSLKLTPDTNSRSGVNGKDSKSGEYNSSECAAVEEELLEQRSDEKLALESIYGESFTEKLKSNVWELKLPLPHLLKYLPKEKKDLKVKDPKFDKKVCQYFLAGHCKFGRKCGKKHVQPVNTRATEDGHLKV